LLPSILEQGMRVVILRDTGLLSTEPSATRSIKTAQLALEKSMLDQSPLELSNSLKLSFTRRPMFHSSGTKGVPFGGFKQLSWTQSKVSPNMPLILMVTILLKPSLCGY
jgi:hypothetical protein